MGARLFTKRLAGASPALALLWGLAVTAALAVHAVSTVQCPGTASSPHNASPPQGVTSGGGPVVLNIVA
jgi:hypothetical protein